MKDKLKPCPFCGAIPKEYDGPTMTDEMIVEHLPHCYLYNLERISFIPEYVEGRWNTRKATTWQTREEFEASGYEGQVWAYDFELGILRGIYRGDNDENYRRLYK